MKAMVLAAGLGTRLQPLTNDRPKALVEVGGRTMLEIALTRLASFGIREIVVNVHHHAQMIVDYLAAEQNFGLQIEISHEEDLLLDTGGGIKNAAPFFLRNGSSEPFLVHNVDVLSAIDFNAMLEAHRTSDALATLAVKTRPSARQLLFDQEGMLAGRRAADGSIEWARPTETPEPLAFCGMHVLSPRIFPLLCETGAFPIIPAYLRLAAEGERIAAYRAEGVYWRDLGRPQSINEAASDLAAGLCQ